MAAIDAIFMWKRPPRFEKKNGFVSIFTYYSVLMESPADPPEDAALAVGVPREGDLYVSTTLPTPPACAAVRVVEKQGALLYVVEVEYNSAAPVIVGSDNPLLDPPIIDEFDAVTFTEEADTDLDGQQLVNTAFDPFHGLTKERSDSLVIVLFNLATFNVGIQQSYQQHVNSEVIFGCAAATVYCRRIRAKKATRSDIDYWACTGEFQVTFYPDGVRTADGFGAWDWIVLSQGLNHLPGGERVNKTIIRIKGKDVTSPQLINGDGEYTTAGTGTPFHCLFKRYPRANFGDLGL